MSARRSSRLGLRDLLLDRLRVKGVVLGFMVHDSRCKLSLQT